MSKYLDFYRIDIIFKRGGKARFDCNFKFVHSGVVLVAGVVILRRGRVRSTGGGGCVSVVVRPVVPIVPIVTKATVIRVRNNNNNLTIVIFNN